MQMWQKQNANNYSNFGKVFQSRHKNNITCNCISKSKHCVVYKVHAIASVSIDKGKQIVQYQTYHPVYQ